MGEKTIKGLKGKTVPADTARVGGAGHAPHDHGAEKSADTKGDNRTPEKTIGEIKYARDSDKQQAES